MFSRWRFNAAVGRYRRAQWVLALLLLGVAVTVPGRLAAQQANPKNSAGDGSASPPSRENAGPARSDGKPKAEALIVGAWNVGGEGESKLIVFKPDGRYEDRGVNLFCEEQEIRSGDVARFDQVFVASQGKWQVRDNRLELVNSDRVAFWDKAQPDNRDRANATCRFDILRLDNGLLRLRLVPDRSTQRGTFFFRRGEEKSINQEFSAVPPEFRRVLAAAELTPDEAAAMVDWLKAQKLDSPAQLEVIDRLAQARRHEMTLAQLFGMTPEEATAFHEVVGQVNGDYERLKRLAATDQLTATERQAVEKVTSVVTDLIRLADQMPMDINSRIAVRGRGGVDVAEQIAAETQSQLLQAQLLANGGFGGQVGSGFGNPNGVAAAVRAPGGRGGRAATATARGRGGRGGRGMAMALAPNAETLDETQREAVVKLNTYLAEQGNWFWRTVFPTE